MALTLEAAVAIVGLMNERTAPAALRRAEALRDRFSTLVDPPVYLLVMLAYYAATANRAAEARELAQRALVCEPYPPPLDICTLLILTLRLVECYEALRGLCEDLLAAARRDGAMQETVAILVRRAAASYDCGALADAEADARWALEPAAGRHRLDAVTEVVRVLIERDELDQAHNVLEQCSDPRQFASTTVSRFLIVRGRLRGAPGRLEDALHDFLSAGGDASRSVSRG